MTTRSTAELTSSFARGLQTQFQRYYDIAVRTLDPNMAYLSRDNIGSNGLSETYQMWNSVPRLSRWREGAEIPSKGFDGLTFSVENLEFGRRIPFLKNQIADDRTGAALDWARDLAMDRPSLMKRLFFQVLNGNSDVDGLDAIPSAPDGQALFATTNDGSASRFNVSGGNLLTASGTGAGNVRDDFYAIIQQFGLMQDTEGRELWPEEVRDQGYVVAFPMGRMQVMETALKQELGLFVTDASAPANQLAKKLITLWPTQFMTGTSFVVGLKGAAARGKQTIFFQQREPIQVETSDLMNSDDGRKKGEVSLQAHTRLGVGVQTPGAMIKAA